MTQDQINAYNLWYLKNTWPAKWTLETVGMGSVFNQLQKKLEEILTDPSIPLLESPSKTMDTFKRTGKFPSAPIFRLAIENVCQEMMLGLETTTIMEMTQEE